MSAPPPASAQDWRASPPPHTLACSTTQATSCPPPPLLLLLVPEESWVPGLLLTRVAARPPRLPRRPPPPLPATPRPASPTRHTPHHAGHPGCRRERSVSGRGEACSSSPAGGGGDAVVAESHATQPARRAGAPHLARRPPPASGAGLCAGEVYTPGRPDELGAKLAHQAHLARPSTNSAAPPATGPRSPQSVVPPGRVAPPARAPAPSHRPHPRHRTAPRACPRPSGRARALRRTPPRPGSGAAARGEQAWRAGGDMRQRACCCSSARCPSSLAPRPRAGGSC